MLTDQHAKDGSALLLIDVINDFEFDGGEALLQVALPAANKIAALSQRARASEVPVIYVNDNWGRWRSDFRSQIERCMETGRTGRAMVEKVLPEEADYFVLKPMHSGFFSTTLEPLLKDLSVHHLILTGFATDLCVLYTANDAYMRKYSLAVPKDCVAAESEERQHFALSHIERRLKADTKSSDQITF